jgi:hypothetical protein
MVQEIKLLDVVALLSDVPEEKLHRGETGTIVEDFGDGCYLVEFSDNFGRTYALPELKASQLLVLHKVPVAEVLV